MACTKCSLWCSHCHPAVCLASVQDHLLEMLHFLWLCKSEYKLKPLWEGPSSPGFVTPTTSFSNWAAIILFFFFFFPSAPYSCSLFPMAHEAETFSSVFLISVLLLWCCKGQQAAADGQQEGGSATSLCSLKGTLCVCVPSGTCPVTCLEWIVSHSIRAVWCGQWQTKPNQTKQVLSSFHPLFVGKIVSFRTARQMLPVGAVCGGEAGSLEWCVGGALPILEEKDGVYQSTSCYKGNANVSMWLLGCDIDRGICCSLMC